jgi:hypothetical protein
LKYIREREKKIGQDNWLTVSSGISKNLRNLLAPKTLFLASEGQPKRATFFKSLPDNHLENQISRA